MINLLSQIPTLTAAPALSTNTSVGIAQDFTALLTEFVGAFPEPSAINGQAPPTNDDRTAIASPVLATHQHVVPADLKKVEINIDHELPKAPPSDLLQESEPKVQPPIELPIQPLITTNAITNVRQSQLPLWVMAIKNTFSETKPAELQSTLPVDLKHELPKVPASDLLQEPEPKSQPPIELPIQPLITTNAITNVQQPQLPLWVMAIKNGFSETKPAELQNTLPVDINRELPKLPASDLRQESEPKFQRPIELPIQPLITTNAITNVQQPQLPLWMMAIKPPVSAKPAGQLLDSPHASEKTEPPRPAPRSEVPAGPKQDISTIQATIVSTVAAILDRQLANAQPPSETVSLDAKPSETNQLDPRTALINELAAAHPDPQAVLADVKRLEINIDHEVPKFPSPEVQAKPEQVSQPLITTDAITNVQQPQLPLRVMAIQKVLSETKPAERKNTSTSDDNPPQATSTNPTPQVPDMPRVLEKIEHPLPAQLIEVPDIPKLQVVRTVAMEVGDAQSQVIVRIEDRGSGINLHFGTGSEAVHRTIESSVDFLVSALKQEKIDVSNVEVSRKSPIDKVRRMKEAH